MGDRHQPCCLGLGAVAAFGVHLCVLPSRGCPMALPRAPLAAGRGGGPAALQQAPSGAVVLATAVRLFCSPPA